MEKTVKIKADKLALSHGTFGEKMMAEVIGEVINCEEVMQMLYQNSCSTKHMIPPIEVIRPDGESKKYVPAGYAYGVPEIEEVMHKEGATIIKWADGTKTPVVCGEGETYDPYTGFMAAVVKKMFGGTGAAKSLHANKNLEAQAALLKAAEEKAKKEAEQAKAEWERQNAEKIAKRKAKAEKRLIARMAEEIRIEMLAKEQAKTMIKAEREKVT